jgi:iron complex transport system permease protein
VTRQPIQSEVIVTSELTHRGRRRGFLVGLAVLVILAGLGSLLLGPVSIAPARALAVFEGHGDAVARAILLELRLPRALLGLLVGAMLGLSGAVLQGYLRNPLAEPAVLGASNAAALGAVGALYFGLAQAHPALRCRARDRRGADRPCCRCSCSRARAESPLTLILAGIALATLAGAGISLALNLSPNPFAAMEIMSWLLGSLENRSFEHVWLALPCIAVGCALLLFDGARWMR